jgi:hypothetical protein
MISLLIASSMLLSAQGAQPVIDWKSNFREDGVPKPLNDPADLRLWPNKTSKANGDLWIVKNHDRIRQMRPRLLLINFSNEVDAAKPMALFKDLMAAIKESSRYHGYSDKKAPAFLDYQVWRYVDMRDPKETKKNSFKAPRKTKFTDGLNCDYGGFFSDRFAEYIGVVDPKNKGRYLRLDELIDQGYVNEVWFTCAPTNDFGCLECIEMKNCYDENFKRIPSKVVQAGNGGDDDMKWTGRPVRINCFNETRGIGCAMENLGHSFEGMAHSGCIPYLTKYFHEFGMFDLDKKYKLPFDSYYALWGEGKGIGYPDPHTAVVKDGDKSWTLKDYVATGGNVHFMPNGRSHYDLENRDPVMSTIEDWRIGSGTGHKDLAKPWTNAVLDQYKELAPDCMGRWLVYWRQNFPGYKNRSKDDNGKRMKNWLPFLFY